VHRLMGWAGGALIDDERRDGSSLACHYEHQTAASCENRRATQADLSSEC
jgi:hypothetical protein